MPKPHDLFQYTRADEVAECWEDVPQALYARLWSLPAEPIPNLEDSGPFDHVGHNCLATHWKLLTTAEQRQLNQLAKLRNAALWAFENESAPDAGADRTEYQHGFAFPERKPE